MAQHAELASPSGGQCGEAGRDAGQADHHSHGFQQIGDGEGAVEDTQADGADFAGAGGLQRTLAAGGDQRRGYLIGDRAGRERDGGIIGQPVAGQAAVVGQIDHQRAGLP